MGTTLDDLLRRTVQRRGGDLALTDEGVSLTWAGLDDLAGRLGAVLQDAGVRPGDRVASLMPDGPLHVALSFALARIGGVRVGVNHRLSPPEIATQLAHAGVGLALVADAFASLVPGDDTVSVLTVGAADGRGGEIAERLAGADPAGTVAGLTEDDLFAICYTTGSTGAPKGAMWSHRNVVEAISHTAFDAGITHDDVWLHCLPGAGVPGLLGLWNVTLGWRIVNLAAFDPQRCLDLIEAEGVTATVWVPTMLAAVLDAQEAAPRDLSSLRKVVYGSAPATPALIRRAMALLPGVALEQWYGSTEGTGGWFTRLSFDDHRRALDTAPSLLTSAGRPMHHVEVAIRAMDGAPVPAGEDGEIWVRGDVVMQGYLDAPDLTAETLDGNGWLCTGDLGHLDDEGYVYLVDRKSFMIISGGYNVYPIEVENAIAELDGVREVCVFGVPDDRWGEAVKALVVAADGAALTEDAVIEHCRGRLASFKLPKSVEFRTELLRGPTGKIAKKDHKAEYWPRP